MLTELKKIVRQSGPWRHIASPIRNQAEVEAWFRAGRPAPPPHAVKARNLLAVADFYGIDVLVETGTFKGDMIEACKNRFKKIYSIEIFEPLANDAKRRFSACPNVSILCGDSANVLPQLLPSIQEPILFWLDGHYSGDGTGKGADDSPVVPEIESIARLRPAGMDAILIDDARLFDGTAGYPAMAAYLESLRNQFSTEVRLADDAVIILPRSKR